MNAIRRSPARDFNDYCNDFLGAAYRFVVENETEWKLAHDVDLEVTNHVLRVRIQDGTIADHAEDVFALCRAQHSDGGFGNTRDDGVSRLRSTAFCTQMLLRANRVLRSPEIAACTRKATQLIVERQLADGSWADDRWHDLDATSVSVGTLLFYTREPECPTDAPARQALPRGLAYIRSQRHDDGLWYYKATASPVTISAHLLQKCATSGGDPGAIRHSARALMRLQASDGHWDKENVDHTCDATRCLLLCGATVGDVELRAEVHEAALRALEWILRSATAGGLGDRPGRKPHVERTCDGIDTVLKFRRFCADEERLVTYWR